MLAANENIKRVFLGDNSIVCDERLAPFQHYFDDPKTKLYSVALPNDLKCVYPAANQDKFLDQISYSSLPKSDGFGEERYARSF